MDRFIAVGAANLHIELISTHWAGGAPHLHSRFGQLAPGPKRKLKLTLTIFREMIIG